MPEAKIRRSLEFTQQDYDALLAIVSQRSTSMQAIVTEAVRQYLYVAERQRTEAERTVSR